MIALSAKGLMEQEACALLTRLDSVRAFSMHMPMVMAAAVTPTAMTAMEDHMSRTTTRVKSLTRSYLHWLCGPDGRAAAPWQAQRRLTALRLWFAAMLSQFDIFAEAITQRSEHDYGIWLSGLDVLAEDAMSIPTAPYSVPPVVCYLDRGIGAAIRRIRTRLPGGTANPVTIIRVPRERMIGSGIAASVVHECGHQVAALLGLVPEIRRELRARSEEISDDPEVVGAFSRWTSEIVSDLWSVGKLGIGATLGVLTVVSLPRALVVRANFRSSHPTPWIRVKLSAAMGHTLYPDPQWARLSSLWEQLYPLDERPSGNVRRLRKLEEALPRVASLLVNHRSQALGGRTIRECLPAAERAPLQLRSRYETWRTNSHPLPAWEPTLLFAVMGQAKFDGRLGAREESELLNTSLRRWALRRALDTGARCAVTLQRQPALHSKVLSKERT